MFFVCPTYATAVNLIESKGYPCDYKKRIPPSTLVVQSKGSRGASQLHTARERRWVRYSSTRDSMTCACETATTFFMISGGGMICIPVHTSVPWSQLCKSSDRWEKYQLFKISRISFLLSVTGRGKKHF